MVLEERNAKFVTLVVMVVVSAVTKEYESV